ncbi:hypothetical protein [Nocardia stercoris]|uniref:hypothetical protein n=1 Tax=Nocardia stercoris TaxID=2483361 RepID=UPI001319C419|nr:hypothetical protein [Nocardia stercoris]
MNFGPGSAGAGMDTGSSALSSGFPSPFSAAVQGAPLSVITQLVVIADLFISNPSSIAV